MTKLPKNKKCKSCRLEFTPERPLQSVCGFKCACDLANKKRIAQEAIQKRAGRAETKKLRDAIKPRSKWLAECQSVVNKFVRMRDAKEPCISCRRFHQGQYHAGHYRSVGACPELRFEENNIHKQCAPCNNHLSGNIVEFRRGLIEKLGLPMIEWLEGKHEPLKLSIEDIKAIKSKYAALCKQLEKGE